MYHYSVGCYVLLSRIHKYDGEHKTDYVVSLNFSTVS